MNKNIFAALALSLFALPLASSAYAQCVPGRPCPTSGGQELSDPVPTVCFYSGEAQTGTFFCEAGQRSVAAVPAGWRSRIKSIGVGENSSVRVCSKDTLQGTCELIDKNVDTLPKGLFNHVHSYDIRQPN